MVKDRFIRQLWISFGIIVLSGIIAGIALYFFSGDLDVQAKAIISDRAQALTQTTAIATLASLEQAAPKAAPYQAAMDQLLPSQYTLVNFGQWFSTEGGHYTVTADASLLQNAMSQPSGSTPGTAPFSFTLDGSLSDITAFLSDAENKSTEFLFSFGSFQVVPDGANYKVTGQGTIFFQ